MITKRNVYIHIYMYISIHISIYMYIYINTSRCCAQSRRDGTLCPSHAAPSDTVPWLGAGTHKIVF